MTTEVISDNGSEILVGELDNVKVGVLHDEGGVCLDIRGGHCLQRSHLRVKEDRVDSIALTTSRSMSQDRLVSVATKEEESLLKTRGNIIGIGWSHGDGDPTG